MSSFFDHTVVIRTRSLSLSLVLMGSLWAVSSCYKQGWQSSTSSNSPEGTAWSSHPGETSSGSLAHRIAQLSDAEPLSDEVKEAVAADVQLSGEELRAIAIFTDEGGDYRWIRSVQAKILNRDSPCTDGSCQGFATARDRFDFYHKWAMHLEGALSKLPAFEGTIYRGMSDVPTSAVEQYFHSWDQNRDFALGPENKPATTSATLSPSVAQRFALKSLEGPSPKSLEGRYNIVFEINQRSARSIESYAQYSHEREVLIRMDARFRVKNIRYLDRNHKVLLISLVET